jgi:hypothetical protein
LPRPSLAARRHDPFWDLDGADARRVRSQRRLVRYGTWLIALLVTALLATRLPSVDPTFLMQGEGRPILAGAIMVLLAASVLLALSRIRHTTEG